MDEQNLLVVPPYMLLAQDALWGEFWTNVQPSDSPSFKSRGYPAFLIELASSDRFPQWLFWRLGNMPFPVTMLPLIERRNPWSIQFNAVLTFVAEPDGKEWSVDSRRRILAHQKRYIFNIVCTTQHLQVPLVLAYAPDSSSKLIEELLDKQLMKSHVYVARYQPPDVTALMNSVQECVSNHESRSDQ